MYRRKWNNMYQMFKLLALGGVITGEYNLTGFLHLPNFYNKNVFESEPSASIIVIRLKSYIEAHHFKENT